MHGRRYCRVCSDLCRAAVFRRFLAAWSIRKSPKHRLRFGLSGIAVAGQATWTGMALLVWLRSPSAPMYSTCGLKFASSASL